MNKLVSFLNQISPLSEQTIALVASAFVADKLYKGDYFIGEGVYAKEIAFL
jgi:hypothetical protein